MEHRTAKLSEPQASLRLTLHELYSNPNQDDAATARRRGRRRIADALRTPTPMNEGATRPTKARLELALELEPQLQGILSERDAPVQLQPYRIQNRLPHRLRTGSQ